MSGLPVLDVADYMYIQRRSNAKPLIAECDRMQPEMFLVFRNMKPLTNAKANTVTKTSGLPDIT